MTTLQVHVQSVIQTFQYKVFFLTANLLKCRSLAHRNSVVDLVALGAKRFVQCVSLEFLVPKLGR